MSEQCCSYIRRLAARKGKKRAMVAVAHTILGRLCHMLKNHQTCRELGADFLDRCHGDQVKPSLLKRLERLGVVVTVQEHREHHRTVDLSRYFQERAAFLG